MKAVVLTGAKTLRWEEREMPKPKSGELLIKTGCVGVCGSDLHFYADGRLGNYVVDDPLILGHEVAGTVVEVGSDVTGFDVGDRVAVEPGAPCGRCPECLKGLYNLCKTLTFMAVPGQRDGVFSEYFTNEAKMCFKLPDNVTMVEGAMVEPLSVGMHAAELADAKIGQTAVVLGCGCIGLVTIMTLRARGVKTIYAMDVMEKRLDMAMKVGATKVFNAKNEDIKEFIMSLPDQGVDLVFECAGNATTTLLSAKLLKAGGTVTLVGLAAQPELAFDFGTLNAIEGRVLAVFRYRNMYPVAIDAVKNKSVPLEDIVTHRFSFSDTIEGIKESEANKSEIVKAVIVFDS